MALASGALHGQCAAWGFMAMLWPGSTLIRYDARMYDTGSPL